MLEDIIMYMGSVGPAWIYVILFFFSFIENVFPPSPSDVVVVVGAALIASTSISYLPVLIITSIGSALGFILMYYVGKLFGDKVVRSGKIKFISQEDISKTDIWFTKYGYKLILANRFLPGTRSVISFFAGIYELELRRTFLFAAVSAFAWNAIIIYLGMALGNNVKLIDYYLSTYSTIVLVLTAIVIAILIIRYIINRSKA
jgi:membrane protein DedA with SNARE-associated domain